MNEPVRCHTIRLRGPWEYRLLAAQPHDRLTAGRMDIEALHGEISQCSRGQIELIRKFTSPTNLDPDERVFLIIGPDAAGVESVTLNGQTLAGSGHSGELQFLINDGMEQRNVLRIVAQCGKLRVDQTRLEIRSQ